MPDFIDLIGKAFYAVLALWPYELAALVAWIVYRRQVARRRGAFGEAVAQAWLQEVAGATQLDDQTFQRPWSGREVVMAVGRGGGVGLGDSGTSYTPPTHASLIRLSFPGVTSGRLPFTLVKEWEPLWPSSWPGEAFAELAIAGAVREAAPLQEAMQSLLSTHPVVGLHADDDGTVHFFFRPEEVSGAGVNALFDGAARAAEILEAQAPDLEALATSLRPPLDEPPLPATTRVPNQSSGTGGASVAVPVMVRGEPARSALAGRPAGAPRRDREE